VEEHDDASRFALWLPRILVDWFPTLDPCYGTFPAFGTAFWVDPSEKLVTV